MRTDARSHRSRGCPHGKSETCRAGRPRRRRRREAWQAPRDPAHRRRRTRLRRAGRQAGTLQHRGMCDRPRRRGELGRHRATSPPSQLFLGLGRRGVLGRTHRRIRWRVHVRGRQPLQAHLRRGMRGAPLPRHARHGRRRPDRRIGQTTRQKSRATASPLTTSPVLDSLRHLGGPIWAKLLPRRPFTAHAGWVDTSTMTGMRSPWAPRQNGWDYRSCPGSHAVRLRHARDVNGFDETRFRQ